MISVAEANIMYQISPNANRKSPMSMWGEVFRQIQTFPRPNRLKYPAAFDEQTAGHCLQVDLIEFDLEDNPIVSSNADQFLKLPTSANGGGADSTDFVPIKDGEKSVEIIVRRAEPLEVYLTFFREYDPTTDEIEIQFEPENLPPKQTFLYKITCLVTCPQRDRSPFAEDGAMKAEGDDSRLRAHVVRTDNRTVTCEIRLPSGSPLGYWRMSVVTRLKKGRPSMAVTPTTPEEQPDDADNTAVWSEFASVVDHIRVLK